MLITNGTCVSTIMNTSAGSSGSRRRHDSLSAGPGRRDPVSSPSAVVVVMASAASVPSDQRSAPGGHHCPTCDAMCWQFLSAASIDDLPAITAENCCVHWLPTSWNSGIPTYWTPGRPGRFVVPGLSIGAAEIASSVGWANAAAAFLYWGIS